MKGRYLVLTGEVRVVGDQTISIHFKFALKWNGKVAWHYCGAWPAMSMGRHWRWHGWNLRSEAMRKSMTKKVPVQIGDGCAVTDDIVYVSAFPDALDDESRFTRLFAMNASTEDKWFHHDLDGHRVVSVCLRRAEPDRPRAVCSLSDEGAVEIANSGAQVIEQIPGAGMEAGSRGLGPMRRIREIGKQLYACGAGNQVYVRREPGWVTLDQQLPSSAQQGMADVVDRLRSKQGSMSEDDLLALTESVGRVGGLTTLQASLMTTSMPAGCLAQSGTGTADTGARYRHQQMTTFTASTCPQARRSGFAATTAPF